jgi:hypothetical protein
MQMYKFDTHVHAGEVSFCGLVPGSEMVRLYKETGYCGIITTDLVDDGYSNRTIASRRCRSVLPATAFEFQTTPTGARVVTPDFFP